MKRLEKTPPLISGGSIATPSLVAEIMNAKYVNGMPLARQEREFARYGLNLSTKTMANWISLCADRYLKLLYEKVPFIVDGKQVYLPFMAVYLQERSDEEKIDKKELLPASQVVLLYFIYHGSGKQIMSRAVTDLKWTSTSVSRAVRQLEELGLLRMEKDGVQKILYSEQSAKGVLGS